MYDQDSNSVIANIINRLQSPICVKQTRTNNFYNPRIMLLYKFPTIIAIISSHLAQSLSVNNQECIIKICHNKDCTKRGGGERLCQTFRDLIPPPSSDIIVPVTESSGCL